MKIKKFEYLDKNLLWIDYVDSLTDAFMDRWNMF
jgi:hypothetical protein